MKIRKITILIFLITILAYSICNSQSMWLDSVSIGTDADSTKRVNIETNGRMWGKDSSITWSMVSVPDTWKPEHAKVADKVYAELYENIEVTYVTVTEAIPTYYTATDTYLAHNIVIGQGMEGIQLIGFAQWFDYNNSGWITSNVSQNDWDGDYPGPDIATAAGLDGNCIVGLCWSTQIFEYSDATWSDCSVVYMTNAFSNVTNWNTIGASSSDINVSKTVSVTSSLDVKANVDNSYPIRIVIGSDTTEFGKTATNAHTVKMTGSGGASGYLHILNSDGGYVDIQPTTNETDIYANYKSLVFLPQSGANIRKVTIKSDTTYLGIYAESSSLNSSKLSITTTNQGTANVFPISVNVSNITTQIGVFAPYSGNTSSCIYTNTNSIVFQNMNNNYASRIKFAFLSYGTYIDSSYWLTMRGADGSEGKILQFNFDTTKIPDGNTLEIGTTAKLTHSNPSSFRWSVGWNDVGYCIGNDFGCSGVRLTGQLTLGNVNSGSMPVNLLASAKTTIRLWYPIKPATSMFGSNLTITTCISRVVWNMSEADCTLCAATAYTRLVAWDGINSPTFIGSVTTTLFSPTVGGTMVNIYGGDIKTAIPNDDRLYFMVLDVWFYRVTAETPPSTNSSFFFQKATLTGKYE